MKNKRLIAKIFNGEDVVATIDKTLLHAEFGALDRGNITDVVNWGIYANRGSISFIDDTGLFNSQTINSSEIIGYSVKFYLVDKTKETLISTFNLDNFKTNDENTGRVDIETISKLLDWETEKIKESIYPFENRSIYGCIREINDSFPNYNLEIASRDYNISSTVIGCPFFEKDSSMWSISTKLCQASMGRVVERPDGTPEIGSCFPQRDATIIIKPKNIIDIVSYGYASIYNASITPIKRNKIEGLGVEETQKTFEIEVQKQNGVFKYSNGIEIAEDGVSYYWDSFGNISETYATGTINFQTPYTIKHIYSNPLFTRKLYEYPSGAESYIIDENASSSTKLIGEKDFSCDLSFNIYKKPQSTTQGFVAFKIDGFKDEGYSETYEFITNKNKKTVEIQSSDLVQDISYFDESGAIDTPLGKHILDEVKRRYSKGVECFEIECLFGDYYDENGNKVFDREDLSKHFERYDVVIPYVKRKGKTVPLRLNEKGEPKKFRIIGISYSYDGLLRQKLQLQEERYDVD